MRPRNVTFQQQLTNYAFGLMQDLAPMRELANLLAPVVPTGGSVGTYNTFNDTAAFKAYAGQVARRAIGGQAQEIGFLSSTGSFSADPYGLRINIDEHERKQCGDSEDAFRLMQEAKVRTLTVQCVLSHLVQVIDLIKANVSAASGKGSWNEANVDPIVELNEQIVAVWRATGILPNQVVMDFGAWNVLFNNPLIIKRMPGADIAKVSPERIQTLLVNPAASIRVVETSVLYGGGFGNASATKRGITGGSALIMYTSPVPTVYDPSAFKTFAPSANLFTEVYTYRQEPHLEWYENDWTSESKVISAALCKRIDVDGANG